MNPVRSGWLGLMLLLSLLVPLEKAMADQERGQNPRRSAAAGALTLPLAGTILVAPNQPPVGQFSGTVTINRFVVQNHQIVAVAIVRGTVTNSAGQVLKTGLQTVVLPVTTSQTAVTFATLSSEPRIVQASLTKARGGRFMLAQAQACGILHLDIGGNQVNLLGFLVNLSPITLDISGDSAGPLGALVCQILDLLGNAAAVVGLLNQILGLVTGLVGGLLGGLGGLGG